MHSLSIWSLIACFWLAFFLACPCIIDATSVQADAGVAAIVSGRNVGGVQYGAERFSMRVPNNKVG